MYSDRQCAACRLDMRKHLIIFVVFLSLLVAVHLTVWCCIFASKTRPLLRTAVSNTGTLTNSSAASVRTPTSKVTESVIEVDVEGDFADRIARFNVELHRLRQQLLLTSPGTDISETTCRTTIEGLGTGSLRVVSSIPENYFDELSAIQTSSQSFCRG